MDNKKLKDNGLYLINVQGDAYAALYDEQADDFATLVGVKTIPASDVTKSVLLGILLFSNGSDPDTEFATASVMREAFGLFKVKHQSYGPGNISAFGERGVFVRVWDKFMRLYRVVWNGMNAAIADEKIDDTWYDVLNYAAIALVLRQGKWPKFELDA